MLPSFETAHHVHGRIQKVLAAECDVCDRQFYKWATGRAPCPTHKRQSVDRAFRKGVDWQQYDRECAALHRPKTDAVPADQPDGWGIEAPIEPEQVEKNALEEMLGG